MFKLTNRENEIVTLLAQGCDSKEVAAKLFISKRTVDFHIDNIMDRTGMSNRITMLMACGYSLIRYTDTAENGVHIASAQTVGGVA